MGSVTFPAGGAVGIPLGCKRAVNTSGKVVGNLRVASSTINLILDCFTGTLVGGVHLGVTLAAVDVAVTGFQDPFVIHVKGSAVVGGLDVGFMVTGETVLIRHSLIIKNFAGFMGLVTVHTGRQDMRFFFPTLTLDDLPVDILDPGMAFGAGF